MRLLGLRPNMRPIQSHQKLKRLLNEHVSWAKDRLITKLHTMLRQSTVIMRLWHRKRLVGFDRTHSDEIYRAISNIWDLQDTYTTKANVARLPLAY